MLRGRHQELCHLSGEKRKLEVLHPNVIYLKGQTDRGVAEIALQYNSSYNELLLSFANNVNTPGRRHP